MSLEFGSCPCGGTYERQAVEVTLKIEGSAVSLKSVPQGVCPECGSRVYKAATLRCIESLMKQHEFRLD